MMQMAYILVFLWKFSAEFTAQILIVWMIKFKFLIILKLGAIRAVTIFTNMNKTNCLRGEDVRGFSSHFVTFVYFISSEYYLF